MTVVDNIEENIEKGKEAIEDLSKEVVEVVSKDGKNALEKSSEKVKKVIKGDILKTKSVLKKIEGKIEKGVEKIKEVIEEDAKKVKKTVKKRLATHKGGTPLSNPEENKPKNGEKTSLNPEGKTEEEFGEREEKLAELESLETEKNPERDLEERKKALLERVKKLSGKVETTKTEDLKEQVKIKKKTDMLVPLEEYVKTGIYIGKRAVTPDMKPFVYRRRADGLAIFNTDLIDEKLKEAIEYLSKFNPEDVVLVCKRQAGWEAAEMLSRLTGIRVFKKKYPAGVLTNTNLPDFFENELTIVTDSWIDKNALQDTLRVKKKVLMICDTNNFAKGADKIIIGNNKTSKSLGIIFYILTRGYCKSRGIEADIPDLDWWVKDRE